MIVAKGYRGRYDTGTSERTGESGKMEQVGVLGELDRVACVSGAIDDAIRSMMGR